MPTSVEKFASGGADIAFWARNNSAGYPAGITGTLANGTDSGMSQLYGVQTLNLTVQQPRRVNVTGDDGVVAQFIFQPEELPGGDLVLGVFDADLVAQAQGIKVYTDGDWSTTYLQPESPTYSDMTIIVNSQAKSKDSGSSGSGGYMVTIYPKVNIVPLGAAGLTAAAPTGFSHALVANKTDKKPWGVSFSTANDGTTQAAVIGPFYSENRVTTHTHISDAADLTFTLDKTPAAANSNKVKVYRNGTLLTYTTDYTVNTSTRVLTLVAAGTAADVHAVRYEWTA